MATFVPSAYSLGAMPTEGAEPDAEVLSSQGSLGPVQGTLSFVRHHPYVLAIPPALLAGHYYGPKGYALGLALPLVGMWMAGRVVRSVFGRF